MSASPKIIAAAALLLGVGVAYAATRRASAPPDGGGPVDGQQPDQQPAGLGFDMLAWFPDTMSTLPDSLKVEPQPVDTDAQVAAMLEAIMWAEGTAQRPNPYAVCYGYRFTITDFRDHPAVLGTWTGEPLPEAMCRAAGFGPGCVSTAAGALQIVKPTWVKVRDKLRLPDFGPDSQRAAGAELLRQCGAVDALARGDFTAATRKAATQWASLPGAGKQQPERTLTALAQRFTNAGGMVIA